MKVALFKVSNPDSMKIKLMETLKVNFKLPATQNEMLWPLRNGFNFSTSTFINDLIKILRTLWFIWFLKIKISHSLHSLVFLSDPGQLGCLIVLVEKRLFLLLWEFLVFQVCYKHWFLPIQLLLFWEFWCRWVYLEI